MSKFLYWYPKFTKDFGQNFVDSDQIDQGRQCLAFQRHLLGVFLYNNVHFVQYQSDYSNIWCFQKFKIFMLPTNDLQFIGKLV